MINLGGGQVQAHNHLSNVGDDSGLTGRTLVLLSFIFQQSSVFDIKHFSTGWVKLGKWSLEFGYFGKFRSQIDENRHIS